MRSFRLLLAALAVQALAPAAASEVVQRFSARQGGQLLQSDVVTTTALPLPPNVRYYTDSQNAQGVRTAFLIDSMVYQEGASLFSGLIQLNQLSGNADCGSACSVSVQGLAGSAQTTWAGRIANDADASRHFYFRYDERFSLELHNSAGTLVNARAEATFIAGDATSGQLTIAGASLSAFARPGNVGYVFGGHLNGDQEFCNTYDSGPTAYTSGLQTVGCGALGQPWHEVIVDLGELDPGESLPVSLYGFLSGNISEAAVDVAALAREEAARVGPGTYEGFVQGGVDLRNIGWFSVGAAGDVQAALASLPAPNAGAVPAPSTLSLLVLALLLAHGPLSTRRLRAGVDAGERR